MNMGIKQVKCLHFWLMRHPKLSQWLWFMGLWLSGLATVSMLAYLIKWVMLPLV